MNSGASVATSKYQNQNQNHSPHLQKLAMFISKEIEESSDL